MQVNEPVPDFALPDLEGHVHRLSDFRGKIVLVNFWSAECPWSARADRYLIATISQLKDHVQIITVASNSHETAEMIAKEAQVRHIDLVLRDQESILADQFGAQTTPHTFVIDRNGLLRYRGAIDDVTFRKREPSRFYVAEALEALIAHHLPEIQEAPPYGCMIVREV